MSKLKLYEIDQEIQLLADSLSIDEETGEVLGDFNEVFRQIDSLQMERSRILEYLAKLIMNTRSSATALKEEECRLKKRREALNAKEERLMQILDRECNGVTTDLGIATLSYRRTSRVDVSDEESAVAWLQEHKCTSALKVPVPTVYKAEVKKLLSSGQEIPGCAIIEERSCNLK